MRWVALFLLRYDFQLQLKTRAIHPKRLFDHNAARSCRYTPGNVVFEVYIVIGVPTDLQCSEPHSSCCVINSEITRDKSYVVFGKRVRVNIFPTVRVKWRKLLKRTRDLSGNFYPTRLICLPSSPWGNGQEKTVIQKYIIEFYSYLIKCECTHVTTFLFLGGKVGF